MKPWLLYGANGYTGRLIAEEAKRRGIALILAGRNRSSLEELGQRLSYPVRVFDLMNPADVLNGLTDTQGVLHCAGPFSATSRPMVAGCIEARVHYLDITGEIPVFERVLKQDEACRSAGMIAMSGVGFDIVPSDCLALRLKEMLPDATELTMALRMSSVTSPGTTKTMIEGLHAGGVVRRDGALVRVPSAAKTRQVEFWPGKKPRLCVLFPWGDVATAYYTTGIPNIEFYAASSQGMVALMRSARWLAPVFARPGVQSLLKSAVDRWVKGPEDEALREGAYYLWGMAKNSAGKTVEARLKTSNGYRLTVEASLEILARISRGELRPGAWTPARAFGSDLVDRLPGTEWCIRQD